MILVALTLLAVSATPRQTPPAPTALKAVTACGAIAPAEVSQALATRVARGVETLDADKSDCVFATTLAGSNGQVELAAQQLRGKLDITGELSTLSRAFPGSRIVALPEFGSAWLVDLGNAGIQLHVLRGDRQYFLVSALGFGDSKAVSDGVVSIARKLLARI